MAVSTIKAIEEFKKNTEKALQLIEMLDDIKETVETADEIIVRYKQIENILTQLKEKIEDTLTVMDFDEQTILTNVEVFSDVVKLYNSNNKLLQEIFRPSKEVAEKIELIKNTVRDFEFDITGFIRYYTTEKIGGGVETLTEEDFTYTDADTNMYIVAHYKYYGSNKAGIVYIEPLLDEYKRLYPLDFDVIIDNVLRKYPTIDTIKFKLENVKAITLTEYNKNRKLYLYKPVKIKGTLISLNRGITELYIRAKVVKGSGVNRTKMIAYNLPPQPKLFDSETGQMLRILKKDLDNVKMGIVSFKITDENNEITAMTYSSNLDILIENLGAEMEFWGIIYEQQTDNASAVAEEIFFVTDIKPAEEEMAKLSNKEKQEVEEFLKRFNNGEELLDWMIDNYAPRIKYRKKRDFVWRLKLIHLILAQNSWLNNIEMLHTLILSRPGVGKTTLALYYLPHISKRWKYADRSRMTIPGLLGGYDQVAKETRVGALKSADRGVMVIDEVDKFRNVDKDIIIALNTVMSNGHVSITIGNSSRSLDYQTRPNIMLLGNYSSGKLKKQLEYATDEFEKEKLKEEFIAKEMMEITQHISTFDRIAILDTDIFEYTADSEKEANLLFDSWFESKEEAENEEPTERELRLLKLIRNIMIYNANYIDKKKLRESIKKFKAEIASFIANEELKEEKHRLSNNLMRLIEVIAVLKGEQEVGRETVELAFTLASISRKYKQIYSLKTEELEEYVEEFIEEKIIRELPADGIDVETARRKFRESLSISKFTEIERKELMKLFDTMLREFAQRSEIEIKDNNIRIGQKRLSEALRKLLQYYDSLAIKKKSIGEYYYDIQELADQLKVSSQVALELLKLIAIDDIKRTSIKVDGEVRYVYHVEIDTEKVKDMLNKNAYKNILLNFFI